MISVLYTHGGYDSYDLNHASLNTASYPQTQPVDSHKGPIQENHKKNQRIIRTSYGILLICETILW